MNCHNSYKATPYFKILNKIIILKDSNNFLKIFHFPINVFTFVDIGYIYIYGQVYGQDIYTS